MANVNFGLKTYIFEIATPKNLYFNKGVGTENDIIFNSMETVRFVGRKFLNFGMKVHETPIQIN